MRKVISTALILSLSVIWYPLLEELLGRAQNHTPINALIGVCTGAGLGAFLGQKVGGEKKVLRPPPPNFGSCPSVVGKKIKA